jgi:hypothetical protein
MKDLSEARRIVGQQRGEIERLEHRSRIVYLMLKYQIDVHFRVVGKHRVEAIAPGCEPAIVHKSLTTNFSEALSQAVEQAAISVEDKMIRIRPCTS